MKAREEIQKLVSKAYDELLDLQTSIAIGPIDEAVESPLSHLEQALKLLHEGE